MSKLENKLLVLSKNAKIRLKYWKNSNKTEYCRANCSCGGNSGGSFSKKFPSQHNYKSPKQILWITYLKTSELKSSKSTWCKQGANSLSRFWRQKSNGSDEKSAQRKIAEKRQTGSIYFLQIALRATNNDFLKKIPVKSFKILKISTITHW